jgi:thioredoxin reductase (NADPH)
VRLFFLLAIFAMRSCLATCPQKVDVLVIGGGIGGLTSAIYLARGGLHPLVLEGSAPGGAIMQSNGVQNWPGEIEVSGIDLIDKISKQAKACGAILAQEEAVEVDFSSRPFRIIAQQTTDPSKKRTILADACIIATGAKVRTLGVPGEKKYEFKGVYSCAICDGALYKDRVVAVVGGGDAAVLEAEYLSSIAKKVYVLVRGANLKGVETVRQKNLIKKANVEIRYQTSVLEVLGGKEYVEGVRIKSAPGDIEKLPVDAVFLAIGATPNTELFKGKLALDSAGYIERKNECETSAAGVFAIGDVADPVFRQAICASGEGAKAAMQAQAYVVNLEPVITKAQEVDVVEVKSLADLNQLIRTSKTPVLVDFYATWCAPCRYLSPFLEKVAKELQGKFVVCKVDVDALQEIATLYNIRSMPTVLQINPEGKEEKRSVGSQEIMRYINSLK